MGEREEKSDVERVVKYYTASGESLVGNTETPFA